MTRRLDDLGALGLPGVVAVVTVVAMFASPAPCQTAGAGLTGVAAFQRALEYEFRRGRAAPEARVRALYGQACGDRVRLACEWRTWHRRDQMPRRDAALVFARPCAAGEGVACLAAAWARGRSPGGEARIGRWLATGCRMGVQRACAEHAWRQLHGRGMVADPPGASRVLERTCKAGAWTGCIGLADALDRGIGVPLDRARALDLWRRACGAGELEGCHRYASRQVAGDGLPADAKAATTLWRAACQGGHARSCMEQALSLRQGRGAQRDPIAAAASQRRACELDLVSACPADRKEPREPPRVARVPARAPPTAVPLRTPAPSPAYARPGWRPPKRQQRSYATWLAVGYVAGPLLGALTSGVGVITPPVVHWVHGEGARGMTALGAMLFLPLITASITSSVVCDNGDCSDKNAEQSMLIAAATAYVAWAVYDCTHNATQSTWSRTGWRLTPYASHDPDMGTRLGLSGAF